VPIASLDLATPRPGARSSAVEDRQIETAKTVGVGNEVDFDDLPACNGEFEDDTRLSAHGPHSSCSAIDQRQFRRPGASREGFGHGGSAADLRRCARLHGCGVGPENGVRIQQCGERVEVAVARGGQEGGDDFSPAGGIDVVNLGPSLHATTCAAREMAGRVAGLVFCRDC